MTAIREQALLIGPRRSLVAVMSIKVQASEPPEYPTVVILNSGVVHRVGANRLSVTLARALAAAGLTVVRFDLSGIGDSESRDDVLSPAEAGMADIREALDSLSAGRHSPRFILAGLCQGANFSIAYSGLDDRVVGAILLEPTIPRTLRHRVHHYIRRLGRAESWLNIVRGRNPLWLAMRTRLGRPAPVAKAEPRQHGDSRDLRTFLEQAYARAIGKGVHLLTLCSNEKHYFRGELLDAFPRVRFGNQLRMELLRHADHTFSSPTACESLVGLVVDWAVGTRFGGDNGISVAKNQ